MKKGITRTMIVLAVLLAAFAMIGCGGKEDEAAMAEPMKEMAREDYTGKLVIWTFTDELKDMGVYFDAAYPNLETEYVIIPNQDQVYLNKVNTTLRSGAEVPDAFTGEAAFYKQFIKAGYWEPLGAYGAEDLVQGLVDYVPNSTRDENGEVTALSWQATPGALFYRRGIAEAVLGTDDPAEVSKWTSDINKFYELGEMVKDEFGGEKFLLAGYDDMSQFVYNMRTEPYVVDDVFTLPDALVDFMKISKDMRDNGIELGTTTWQPPWFSSMADGSVMCYILPTWGLHYVMKPNAEPEANEGNADWTGDWGLAVPPASYSWGGTWIGINRNSQNKDLAWQAVKFFGSDPEFLETWAVEKGDFVSNLDVINKIKDDFSEGFLGGQNHYQYFYEEAQKIDVSYIGPWDFQIQNAWGDQIEVYVAGDKDLDAAIEDFYAAVEDILPDVQINR
ncbi:MAG: extracellular solute-binding protein [Desulfobacterales bacterium]|nr:extracellular solute-binding protein [Desulfobacterales bacterium]